MRTFFKWAGITVLGLVGVLVLTAATLYVRGSRHSARVKIEPSGLMSALRSDSASVERGAHLAASITPCAGCHGAGLKGQMFGTPAVLVKMAAPNLTRGRGGVGMNSVADWDRAIRHGIGKDGRRLIIMPAQAYAHMSDDEFAAIVAYLNTLPAIDNVTPARKIGFLGGVLIGSGMFPLAADVVAKEPASHASLPISRSAQYGAHLAELATCTDCHGADLAGKTGGGGPTAPSLHTNAAHWNETQFRNALRTGHTPDGRTLDGEHMPWPYFAGMSDDELGALWLYISSLNGTHTN
jgi:cytochrome c553